MKPIRNALPALLLAIGLPFAVLGSDTTYFGTIDAINGDLGSGGGLMTGTLTSVNDDDWVTFDATAGEVLDLEYRATSTQYLDVVIFRDVNDNGVIEVGDVADVINFNIDQTGAGTDLVVQHSGFTDNCVSPGTDFYCVGTTAVAHQFTAPVTGQYVIGISSANDGQGLDWSVEIVSRGAIAEDVPVPVNSWWALLSMMLLIGFTAILARRRLGNAA